MKKEYRIVTTPVVEGRPPIPTQRPYPSVELYKNYMHVLSEDKTEEGDWYYRKETGTTHKVLANWIGGHTYTEKGSYKIIASTDPSLCLPSLPGPFLEQYVRSEKKPEYVEVEYQWFGNPDLISIEGHLFAKDRWDLRLREDNTIYIETIENYNWKLEYARCQKSPYYFYIHYCNVGKKQTAATPLTEKEFNSQFYERQESK